MNSGGVLDRDFDGNVYVSVFNFTNGTVKLERGNPAAYVYLERIWEPKLLTAVSGKAGLCQIKSSAPIVRGRGGFGSTGHKPKSCGKVMHRNPRRDRSTSPPNCQAKRSKNTAIVTSIGSAAVAADPSRSNISDTKPRVRSCWTNKLTKL